MTRRYLWQFMMGSCVILRDGEIVYRLPAELDYFEQMHEASIACDALNSPGSERERMRMELGI